MTHKSVPGDLVRIIKGFIADLFEVHLEYSYWTYVNNIAEYSSRRIEPGKIGIIVGYGYSIDIFFVLIENKIYKVGADWIVKIGK